MNCNTATSTDDSPMTTRTTPTRIELWFRVKLSHRAKEPSIICDINNVLIGNANNDCSISKDLDDFDTRTVDTCASSSSSSSSSSYSSSASTTSSQSSLSYDQRNMRIMQLPSTIQQPSQRLPFHIELTI